MSAADKAVSHLLNRIKDSPRLAYYFDPITKSMDLLTLAYAEANGLDVNEFRKSYYTTLKFEAPRNDE